MDGCRRRRRSWRPRWRSCCGGVRGADGIYGRDKRGDELPEELAFRETRLRKIREAKAGLEAVASEAALNRLGSSAGIIPWCPATKPGATSPTPNPGSCPAPEGGTFSSPTTARRWRTTPTKLSWRPGPPTTHRTSSRQWPWWRRPPAIWAWPQRGLRRRRVLFGEVVRGTICPGRRPVHGTGPDPTRHGGTAGSPGTDTRQPVPQGPDAPQAAYQAGPATLRPADGNGEAGVRTDQAGAEIPVVPAAGTGKGGPGVAAYLYRAQPAETVPLRGGYARQGTGQWPWQEHQAVVQVPERRILQRPSAGPHLPPAKIVVGRCQSQLTHKSSQSILRQAAGQHPLRDSQRGVRTESPAGGASWIREIRDSCRDQDIKFFYKQWGGVAKKTTGRLLDGRGTRSLYRPPHQVRGRPGRVRIAGAPGFSNGSYH